MNRNGAMKLILIIILIIQLSLQLMRSLETKSELISLNNLSDSLETGSELISLKKSIDNCLPLKNFVFVKTHKTGSTTMTNIFLRYTETHLLNLLMDKKRYDSTEYGDLTGRTYIRPPPNSTHNAFVMHANYNPTFLREKLGENTQFLTILRDPVSQFISGFNYFGYNDKYYKGMNFDESLNAYLDEIDGYGETQMNCGQRDRCHTFVNGQIRDLGFGPKLDEYVTMDATTKQKFVGDYIKKLADELDLVLIAEEFTLSLVLLADKYCMEYDDIYFLKSNQSKNKAHVSNATKERIKIIQSIDFQLYEYFRASFHETVKQEGINDDDVISFIRANDEKTNSCTDGTKIIGGFNTWDFVLTETGKMNFVCRAMNSRDLEFAMVIGRGNTGQKPRVGEKDNGRYLTLQNLLDWRSNLHFDLQLNDEVTNTAVDLVQQKNKAGNVMYS